MAVAEAALVLSGLLLAGERCRTSAAVGRTAMLLTSPRASGFTAWPQDSKTGINSGAGRRETPFRSARMR